MAYSGSVGCACLRRGTVDVPPELRDLVRWHDTYGPRGPDSRSSLRARWNEWVTTAPCGHERFTRAALPLGNNLGVARFVELLERMQRESADPRLLTLIRALPGHHGDWCPPDLAGRAVKALSVLEERAPTFEVSGLGDGERLVWWAAGPRMSVVLAGFSGPDQLAAEVERGVLTLLVEGVPRISGRVLRAEWADDEGLATVRDPDTGRTAQLRWPYRDIPSPRGFTGPLPLATIETPMTAIRELGRAAAEEGMPISWG